MAGLTSAVDRIRRRWPANSHQGRRALPTVVVHINLPLTLVFFIEFFVGGRFEPGFDYDVCSGKAVDAQHRIIVEHDPSPRRWPTHSTKNQHYRDEGNSF